MIRVEMWGGAYNEKIVDDSAMKPCVLSTQIGPIKRPQIDERPEHGHAIYRQRKLLSTLTGAVAQTVNGMETGNSPTGGNF